MSAANPSFVKPAHKVKKGKPAPRITVLQQPHQLTSVSTQTVASLANCLDSINLADAEHSANLATHQMVVTIQACASQPCVICGKPGHLFAILLRHIPQLATSHGKLKSVMDRACQTAASTTSDSDLASDSCSLININLIEDVRSVAIKSASNQHPVEWHCQTISDAAKAMLICVNPPIRFWPCHSLHAIQSINSLSSQGDADHATIVNKIQGACIPLLSSPACRFLPHLLKPKSKEGKTSPNLHFN